MAEKIYTERWVMTDTKKDKEEAMKYAKLTGLTLTAFVRLAIREKIVRDKKIKWK